MIMIERRTGSLSSEPCSASEAQRRQRHHRYLLPGGLTSVNRQLDPPLIFSKAQGGEVVDIEGRSYIDFNCAFGATILGHCHPAVTQRVLATLQEIDLVGLGQTSLEAQVAARLALHVPTAEMALFVNSGTEATLLAVRLARAVTGRRLILKFQGCYHGWHDYLALNVISPANRIGTPDPLSAGMLPDAHQATLVLPFNDCEAVEKVIRNRGQEIAAIILEPIQHNVGSIEATLEFLQRLRTLCTASGIVLIFDEVVTGFRHGLGGYQAQCGVLPDLTTLGKAMGNGFPVSALVGRRSLLERCAPAPIGDVLLAGTFNGSPVCLAAALATIEQLEDPQAYQRLYALGHAMRTGLQEIVTRLDAPAQVAGFGSVWLLYFTKAQVRRYEDLLDNAHPLDIAFRAGMRQRGVLSAPSPFKRYNFCLGHDASHVSKALEAAEDTLRELLPRLDVTGR